MLTSENDLENVSSIFLKEYICLTLLLLKHYI